MAFWRAKERVGILGVWHSGSDSVLETSWTCRKISGLGGVVFLGGVLGKEKGTGICSTPS